MPRTPRIWSRKEAYARWFERPLGRAYRERIERVIGPWIAEAAPRRALDAGCGPILTFVDVFPAPTRLAAVDCSFEMALGARDRLRATGRAAHAACASVAALPFASAAFDFVLSLNCLEFVPDQEGALRELRRVAAPGAQGVLGVLSGAGTWEWARRVRRPFSRAAYYRGRFPAPEAFLALLRAAGWRVLELRATVRFPPLPLVSARWYDYLEPLVSERRAGLLLARVVRDGAEEAEEGRAPRAAIDQTLLPRR